MAIWQYGFTFVPEEALRRTYPVLPLQIPQDLAEDSCWWSEIQPPVGFEQQINLILTERPSWSTSMRMWGQEDGDDAYVCYVDESKSKVEEVGFRINAGEISPELIPRICILARQLNCVLMTAEYEILAPDESMVLAAINDSTAKKYIDDPVSTLLSLGKPEVQKRLQERFRDRMKDKDNDPPRKK
jgi:hypothetical protein